MFPKADAPFYSLSFFFSLIRNFHGFLRVPKKSLLSWPLRQRYLRPPELLPPVSRPQQPKGQTSKRAQHGNRSFGLPRGPTSAALAAGGKHAWQRLCGHCSFLSRQPCADCGKDNYNPQKTAVLRRAEVVIPRAALPPARQLGPPLSRVSVNTSRLSWRGRRRRRRRREAFWAASRVRCTIPELIPCPRDCGIREANC